MSSGDSAFRGDEGILVRFWGTRGGMAVPGHATLRYGGNTSCIELRCGPHLVILDAGTGLRGLGLALLAEATPVTADLLLSHTHLDHIVGLGFFRPLFKADTRLCLHAGHLPADDLRQALRAVLTPPLNPDLLGASRAGLDIRAFSAGESFTLRPGLTVSTTLLQHPGGSTGYRIEWHGRSVVYLTDTEHTPGQDNAELAAFAASADLLIYDATFADDELAAHKGWGHSTWQEALRLADAARAGRLVLFHHECGRSDDDLDVIAATAQRMRPGTVAASEGLVLALS